MEEMKKFLFDIIAGLRKKKSGYVMILVAIALPIFFLGIDYAIKQSKLSHNTAVKAGASYAVGTAVLEKYNPARTWSSQKECVYAAGAQALNDRAYSVFKGMLLPSTTVNVYKAKTVAREYNLTKMYTCFSAEGIANGKFQGNSGAFLTNGKGEHRGLFADKYPFDSVVLGTNNVSYDLYTTSGEAEAYSVQRYAEDKSKLEISFDTEGKYIVCDCKHVDKKVHAYPAECNVDIILTIPTNHAANTKSNTLQEAAEPSDSSNVTPIKSIANAYVDFLKNHFLRTLGVAVGIVPYSGKISLAPGREGWTVAIPSLNTVPSAPYIKQAVCYGTEGREGGELRTGQGFSYDWGTLDVGLPIMYRQGTISKYRGVDIGTARVGTGDGLLLQVSKPVTYTLVTNSGTSGKLGTMETKIAEPFMLTYEEDKYKFQRMNLRPCYLGSCNLLAMACEKDCDTHEANPYFITELTDDVQNVIHNLRLIAPVSDKKNKSNFTFLPVHWAHNLLETWTSHPGSNAVAGEKMAHPVRSTKKQAVILVVNAPDHFEPNELTYLGFNNDNSEIPMEESDCIRFDTNRKEGTKGIIKYTGAGTFENAQFTAFGSGRLTFPEKGLVKLVVGSCQHSGLHKITGAKTFVFSGANLPAEQYCDFYWETNVSATSTGGVNFGHNLSVYKLRYSLDNATITNCILKQQVLRDYGGFYINVDSSFGRKRLILNTGEISLWCYEMKEDTLGYSWYKDTCIQTTGGERGTLNDMMWGIGNLTSNPFNISAYGILGGGKIVASLYTWGIEKKFDQIGYEPDNAFPLHPMTKEIYSGEHYGIKHIEFKSSIRVGERTLFQVTTTSDNATFASGGMVSSDALGYYAPLRYYYILNNTDKGFKANITDEDLLYNRYVGLKKFDEKNWVVFQGDGELHVTVNPESGGGTVRFYDDNRGQERGQLQFANVANDNETHLINEKTEFYIEPSQISDTKDSNGNYYIDFNMNNIQLVSAEITNRKYVKYTSQVTSSGNTITSKDAPETFSIKVKPTSESYIRFNNLNPDNETTNEFKFFGEKTFTFSKSRLPRSRSKFTCSLNYATLNWSVNNRTVEWHGGTSGWQDEGISMSFARGGTATDHVYFYDFDFHCEGSVTHYHSWMRGYIRFCFSEAPKTIEFDCGSSGGMNKHNLFTGFFNYLDAWGDLSLYGTKIDTCDKKGCKQRHYFKESKKIYHFDTQGVNFYDKNIRFYTMIGSMEDLSGTSPDVSFFGRGDITLRAKSTMIPTVTLIDSGGNNSVIEVKEEMTITISPDMYQYEKSGNERDGFTYTVRVNCSNCNVSNLKQITSTTGYRYPTPTPPENSRCVNFFQNSGGKPVRSPSDLIAYGSDESSSLSNTGLVWNNDLTCWVTALSESYAYSGTHHFYNKNIVGDWFLTLESVNSEPRILGAFSKKGTGYNRRDSATEFAGLYRAFKTPDIQREDQWTCVDVIKTGNTSGYPNQYLSGTEITDVDCKMSYAGFTLPINYALYQNGYQHISDDGHLVEYPDDALKNVTADACSKLKAAYSNARIYVIKYKTDYDPYNSCGATITERADTEEQMKTVLSKIAKDIKNYASYKDSVIEDETNSE